MKLSKQYSQYSASRDGKKYLFTCLHRPWGLQDVGSRHKKEARLTALSTGRLYPQEILLVLIYVRGWVDPRAIVRPEGLGQYRISMTVSEIEPWTFRVVTQCLSHIQGHSTSKFLIWIGRFVVNVIKRVRMRKQLMYVGHLRRAMSV